MKEKEKKKFLVVENNKIIKVIGDPEEIDSSFIDESILGNIEKIVKYYAKKFFDYKNPFCQIEETDSEIGFYVDDEESDSNKYYIKIAKIGKYGIIYKIDFTKEDFKKMP